MEVFGCWHPGQMIFDPELKEVVEVDDENPMHQLYLERQAEDQV